MQSQIQHCRNGIAAFGGQLHSVSPMAGLNLKNAEQSMN
ncbi:hypothetical protein HP15_1486 [Marinobacter adhaerens HP15]|uniref:Uncharacterized protein n=1 Tax=Marinobacter adhaerens (strain DSM 23420 / HP15) TaxID=225937 RepID=E4PKF3_MARAH|nr:hypothetical protein HP15_1486 [Marinobacter adhaerens HP15]